VVVHARSRTLAIDGDSGARRRNFASLAAHAQDTVAVILAEVGDVEPARAARIGRWTAI
jgi:hypothetical protein